MPNAKRSASAKVNYQFSALAVRNLKLVRASKLNPAREHDDDCARFKDAKRVMTARDYLARGPATNAQLDLDREAHLLVRDPYNQGEFHTVSIYDVTIKQEAALCEFDLHIGAVLVKPDTLIYWK